MLSAWQTFAHSSCAADVNMIERTAEQRLRELVFWANLYASCAITTVRSAFDKRRIVLYVNTAHEKLKNYGICLFSYDHTNFFATSSVCSKCTRAGRNFSCVSHKQKSDHLPDKWPQQSDIIRTFPRVLQGSAFLWCELTATVTSVTDLLQ